MIEGKSVDLILVDDPEEQLLIAPYYGMRVANDTIPFRYLSAFPTGSRYTTTPPTLDTDDDWLVLVRDIEDVKRVLEERDWEPCLGLSDPYEVEKQLWHYTAFRKGNRNLIVTDDKTMYLRSVGATLVAQRLNLQEKEDRIALFRNIRFGESVTEYTGAMP